MPTSDADERIQEIDRRQRDAKAQCEMADQVHGRSSVRPGPERQLQIEAEHEHAGRERSKRIPLISASFGRNSWLAVLAAKTRPIVDSTRPRCVTTRPKAMTLPSTMSIGRHCHSGSGSPLIFSARKRQRGAEHEQKDAENAREVTRAHARGGAERIVAADDDRGEAEADENQACEKSFGWRMNAMAVSSETKSASVPSRRQE